MARQHCSDEDLRIIGECLAAVVEGPFIPEWEFSTLFGFDRAQVASVMHLWPNVADDDAIVIMVNNSLGNLVGYPHGEEKHWDRFVSVGADRVLDVLQRWQIPRSTA